MPEGQAISKDLLNQRAGGWRGMIRIESVGGSVNDVTNAERMYLPEKLVYAEGDSWFDKFTPIPLTGTNLLDAIRTPYVAAVVDAAHIGDEAGEMVGGYQARQTRAMFDAFAFDAILLSAGGNDLKNLFTDRFKARAAAHGAAPWMQAELDALADPRSYKEFFETIIGHLKTFVGFRNAGRKTGPNKTPILVNGYDYLQPRPAGGVIFANTKLGRGPWLQPAMAAAGLKPSEMRAAADAVVDELNRQLGLLCEGEANMQLIDQRGLLQPARHDATGPDADWLDEIHPNEKGFAKLARNGWDLPLAEVLGWVPAPGELVAADARANASRARPSLG